MFEEQLKFLSNQILSNPFNFEETCLELFHIQRLANPVYKKYIELLGIDAEGISMVAQIPMLPIGFFKTHRILLDGYDEQLQFSSSATTGAIPSKHYIADIELYKKCFRSIFNKFYASASKYCIIGLLPSYLEREGSSLIFMVNDLISQSNHPDSGFYIHDFDKLHDTLKKLEVQQVPTLLFGVTFALLDFAAAFPMKLNHTTMIETGGMKGRKKEMVRNEVHQIIREQLTGISIHSEYGMTELMSQAYALDGNYYQCPSWMKVFVRDITDPLSLLPQNSWGALNIIDLANIYSCAFIATDDIGKVYADGSFEVAGRLDNSDVRGCSLLYQ